ncbi:hypothetical protein SOVF_088130 isoform B [Spinacia oleracea]|nr:hypothetical protein SOVF_088130 isoform B [Spinacia oleracea]
MLHGVIGVIDDSVLNQGGEVFSTGLGRIVLNLISRKHKNSAATVLYLFLVCVCFTLLGGLILKHPRRRRCRSSSLEKELEAAGLDRSGNRIPHKKATEVEKEVTGLGEELSSKLKNLQGKADDIADMVGVSIQKQQQLLASESEALLGIQSLTDFQSKALQESRVTLQQIVGFAQGQHQELKQQQEHLLKAHNLLAINSSYLSIL